jgi:hypothetical protein
VVEGVVTAASATFFTVNSCPPNADCPADTLTTFDIDAPDFQVALEPRFLVRVKYSITRFWACQQSLEVTALQSWGGLRNDAQWPAGALVLAIVDGGGPFADSSYTVERQALGCDVDAGRGCGGITPDEYAFVFAPKNAPDQGTVVPMGDTRLTAMRLGQPNEIAARNLRSFQTALCDDYWNFAYWLGVVSIPP